MLWVLARAEPKMSIWPMAPGPRASLAQVRLPVGYAGDMGYPRLLLVSVWKPSWLHARSWATPSLPHHLSCPHCSLPHPFHCATQPPLLALFLAWAVLSHRLLRSPLPSTVSSLTWLMPLHFSNCPSLLVFLFRIFFFFPYHRSHSWRLSQVIQAP